MNKKQAENEITYRILKILLNTMEADGLICSAESETIRKKLIEKVRPLIGQLDKDGIL